MSNIIILNKEIVPKIVTHLATNEIYGTSWLRGVHREYKYLACLYSIFNKDSLERSKTYIKDGKYSLHNPISFDVSVKNKNHVNIVLYSLHLDVDLFCFNEDINIDWTKINAISIGSLVKLYYGLHDEHNLNQDQKMLLKKILKMDNDKPVGVLGSIDSMREWKWLPSKKESESQISFSNHLVAFLTMPCGKNGIVTEEKFMNLLENFACESNIIKLFNRFLYGENINYVKEIKKITFDEPNSLIDCIKMDIDAEEVGDSIIGFYNVLVQNRKKYGEGLMIIVRSDQDSDHFYSKLSLHKYHNLYFNNWTMGTSYRYKDYYDDYVSAIKSDNKFKIKNILYERGEIPYPREMHYHAQNTRWRYSPPMLDKYTKPVKYKRYVREQIQEGSDNYNEGSES